MSSATESICIIIPTYNNAGTVCDVAGRAAAQGYPVIVVNDGSTDDTAARLAQSGLPVTVLTHPRNRGKGIALRTAFTHAREQGFRYAITLDADGQHFPEDIPVLVEALTQHPGALIVGSRNRRRIRRRRRRDIQHHRKPDGSRRERERVHIHAERGYACRELQHQHDERDTEGHAEHDGAEGRVV